MKYRTGYLFLRGEIWHLQWRVGGKLFSRSLRTPERRQAEIEREKVMAVPNNLVPMLRPYLQNPDDDIGAVKDLIDDALRHALTVLPQALPEGK